MNEGGTQYDLKVGLDTSAAKPNVDGLTADLVKSGQAADVVQDKLTAVSAASGKVASAAKGAGASVASAASSTDRLASSAAKSDSAVTRSSAALGKNASAASSSGTASGKAAQATDILSASAGKVTSAMEAAAVSTGRARDANGRFLPIAGGAAGANDRLAASSTRAKTSLGTQTSATGAATTAADRFAASTYKADASLLKIGKTLLATAATWLTLSSGISAASNVVSTFSSYEDSLIGVSKTTGLVGSNLKEFYGDVVGLSTSTVPLATRDLLDMGAAAGSLGVSGASNILNYSTTIGKLTAASEDLKGTEAATILTQMMNVQGEGPENVDELASVLIRLGLATASTERGIALVALEISKATAPFKLGTTVAAAYGAALAEMKIEAQLGGSAIGRTFREIQAAVSEGSAALDKFAKVAGVSSAEFKKVFQADPNQGMLLFLKGLGTYGREAGLVLERLGLSGDELAKVLPSLGENFERLAGHIRNAQDEQERGTALNDKAALAFNATSSDLQMLSNAYDDVQKAIGEGVSPAIRQVTSELTEFTLSSRDGAQSFGEDLAPAIRTVGRSLIFLAKNLDIATAALGAFLLLKAVAWLAGLVASTLAAVAALKVKIATSRAAAVAAAEQAKAEWAVAFAYDSQAAKAALAASGNNAVAASHRTATAAGSGFLSLAVTPLTIGLTILVGVLLHASNQLEEFSRTAQVEIEKIVDLSDRAIGRIKQIKADTDDLLSKAKFEQELADRLLSKGIKGGSPEADRERDRLRLERQGQYVAKLREEEDALTESRATLATKRAELDKLLASERALTQEQEKNRKAMEAAARSPREGAMTQAAREMAETGSKLDAVRARLTVVQKEANLASASVTTLSESTERLTAETEGYTPPAQEAARTLGDLGNTADKAAQSYAKLTLQVEGATRANKAIAAAYGESSARGREAEQAAADQARVLQALSGVAEKYRPAVEQSVLGQIASEREAAGAKTIAALSDQLAAAEKLASAYQSGLAPAIEEARREQELIGQKIANTTGVADDQKKTIEGMTASLARLNQQNAFAEKSRQIEETNQVLRDANGAWDGTAVSIEKANIALQINSQINQAVIGQSKEEAEALARLIRERERLAALFEARMRLGRLEEDVRKLDALSQVKRSDFRTEREYQKALRDTNTEFAVRSALLTLKYDRMKAMAALKREDFADEQAYKDALASTTAQFDEMAIRTEAAVRSQAALNEQIELQDQTLLTTTQKWGLFADGLDALTGVPDHVQSIVSAFADMIRGITEATEAVNGFGQARGWAMAIQAAYAIAQATGLLDQNKTEGGFGGAGEGNRSAEGSMVGAVIGGIIGAYFGGAAGAQAGMAIGSAAGGILGSFIKKGADEALGELELDSGDIVAKITKNEGSLGRVIQDLGQRINDALNSILDSLGASIDSIPRIQVKVRDGIISVWVGAVNARVKEMDEAITFAVTEILKQADISGLSEVMRKILENTDAMDLDQLAKDLEFGEWYENLGLEDAAIAVENQVREFRARFRQAMELGLDAAPIGEWLREQLVATRNDILGIEEKPEDRIRRQAEAFNQQIDLLRAEQQARKADLLVKKALLQADIDLLKAEIGIGVARLDARGAFLAADSEILWAQLATLQAAMEAIDQALQAVDLILEALGEDLRISQEEIDEAIRRARAAGNRAGAGQEAQDRESFEEELRDIVRGALPASVRAVMELSDQLADLDARAKELKYSEAQLAEARQALIDQTKKEILDPVREYLGPGDGGTYGMSEWETSEADIRRKFDEARAANQALIDETGQRAIAFWKLNQAEIRALMKLAEDAIDSLGLPMEGTRDKVDNLKKTLDFLAKSVVAGTLSVERFDQVIGELAAQSEVELLGMALSLLEAAGMNEENAEWVAVKAALETANYYLQIAQLEFLLNQYVELGLIGKETEKIIRGALDYARNNPPDFEDPNRYRKGNSRQESATGDPWAEFRKLQEEMAKQAKEWRQAGLGPLQKEAVGLKEKLDSLIERAKKFQIATNDLVAAWGVAADKLVADALESFETVPEVVSSARDLRDRLADLDAALLALGRSADAAGQAATTRATAVENFVDGALEEFERLGESALEAEYRDLTDQFDNLRTAFDTIGASADQMARLEEARSLALEDFWARATEGIRGFIAELKAQDPRVSSERGFLDARSEFRAVAARAQTGDLEAVDQLEAAARLYHEQARAFLGGGVGSNRVLDEILALGGDLDLGAMNDPVVDRLGVSNDLLSGILDVLSHRDGGAAGEAEDDSSAASPRATSEYNSAARSGSARSSRSWEEVDGGGDDLPPLPRDGGEGPRSLGGSDELVDAIRRLAQAEARRQAAEEASRNRDRQQRLADSGERAALAAGLAALATEVGALRRVIERQAPPAGG